MVQHGPDGGDLDQRFRGLHVVVVVFREAAMPAGPGEPALDDSIEADDKARSLRSTITSRQPARRLISAGKR